MIDLAKFDFPKLPDADIAFSTVKTDPILLAEAKRCGFYNGSTPYNDLFCTVFYKGGTITLKKGLDPEFKTAALRYFKAWVASFEPPHEEKEAIGALLLSCLVEPEVSEQ